MEFSIVLINHKMYHDENISNTENCWGGRGYAVTCVLCSLFSCKHSSLKMSIATLRPGLNYQYSQCWWHSEIVWLTRHTDLHQPGVKGVGHF